MRHLFYWSVKDKQEILVFPSVNLSNNWIIFVQLYVFDQDCVKSLGTLEK